VQGKALLSKKFLIPLALLLWLLVSLTFMLLIPRAEAYDPTTGCPSNKTEAMEGVYSPQRFRIYNLCQQAGGQVTFYEEWSDGDWNVYVRLDQANKNLVNARSIKNLQSWRQARENGGADMIWEAIPKDQGTCGNPGDLGPEPQAPDPRRGISGEHLTVYGVYVYDKWHQWFEIHPLTQVRHDSNGQTCTRERSG
jgi:hypothetical protein